MPWQSHPSSLVYDLHQMSPNFGSLQSCLYLRQLLVSWSSANAAMLAMENVDDCCPHAYGCNSECNLGLNAVSNCLIKAGV